MTLSATTVSPARARAGLLFTSATALFLEMFLVRWMPSEIPVLGYYSNIVLLGCFLGLGAGALLSGHLRPAWNAAAPLVLGVVLAVPALGRVPVAVASDNFDFGLFGQGVPAPLVVAACFLLAAAVFIPLGQRLADLFGALPPLEAYGWDLGGSLLGTLAFAAQGAWGFQPAAAMAVVAAGLCAGAATGVARLASGAVGMAAVSLLLGAWEPHVHWSPYSHISVVTREGEPAPAPSPDLHTARDPARYVVRVNNHFYMHAAALDPARHANPAEWAVLLQQYTLPHALQKSRNVLVLGAGAGMDVEGALLMGAQRVVAVEIDPVVVELGRAFNASGAYLDPRVEVHVQDARAWLARTGEQFDAVVFGFLDAQALLSARGNVRMDAFVYTRQALEAAARRLEDGGLLSLSFYAGGQDWLLVRIVELAAHACGTTPVVYAREAGQVVVACRRGGGPLASAPPSWGAFLRVEPPAMDVTPTTDDWPFLYLREPGIPADYLRTLALVLVCGLLFGGAAARRAGARAFHPFFFLMGTGFMLLEAHGISTASLLVASNWVVTTAVVAGVLVYVLLANALVLRGWRATPAVMGTLLGVIAVSALVPVDTWMNLGPAARLAVTALWMPLPVFLAGVMFSSAFRDASPAAALGSNLVGAVFGGVLEYVTMAVGSQATQWLVLAIYVACVFLRPRNARGGPAAITARGG